MKDFWQEMKVLGMQYGYHEDLHGFHMDAPELIAAGAITGWIWPMQMHAVR